MSQPKEESKLELIRLARMFVVGGSSIVVHGARTLVKGVMHQKCLHVLVFAVEENAISCVGPENWFCQIVISKIGRDATLYTTIEVLKDGSAFCTKARLSREDERRKGLADIMEEFAALKSDITEEDFRDAIADLRLSFSQ